MGCVKSSPVTGLWCTACAFTCLHTPLSAAARRCRVRHARYPWVPTAFDRLPHFRLPFPYARLLHSPHFTTVQLLLRYGYAYVAFAFPVTRFARFVRFWVCTHGYARSCPEHRCRLLPLYGLFLVPMVCAIARVWFTGLPFPLLPYTAPLPHPYLAFTYILHVGFGFFPTDSFTCFAVPLYYLPPRVRTTFGYTTRFGRVRSTGLTSSTGYVRLRCIPGCCLFMVRGLPVRTFTPHYRYITRPGYEPAALVGFCLARIPRFVPAVTTWVASVSATFHAPVIPVLDSTVVVCGSRYLHLRWFLRFPRWVTTRLLATFTVSFAARGSTPLPSSAFGVLYDSALCAHTLP